MSMIPKPKLPISATVIATSQITSSLRRITFSGNDIAQIPSHRCGGHLKLLLPKNDSNSNPIAITDHWRQHYKTRTYTLRNHRPDQQEIDIDFATHPNPTGPGAKWASETQIGDLIHLTIPSEKKLNDTTAPWYIFLADQCSTPAALAALQDLPTTAPVHAILETSTQDDRKLFTQFSQLTPHWITRSPTHTPDEHARFVLNTIASINFPATRPGFFAAGESSVIRVFDAWAKSTWDLTGATPYISPYWKADFDQDQHKSFKSKLKANSEEPPLITTRPNAFARSES
tara:strand:- start:21449 stop:22309 length:861 start_codon:yes stop_codon:yes gene_type:complete